MQRVNVSAQPSDDLVAPPATLEVLGEHLYAKIEELWEMEAEELDVAKLTGILLELGEQEVLRMLQDQSYLEQCVQTAIQHVPSICRRKLKEEIAEKLYERVRGLDPHDSAHITGMLLELGPSKVSDFMLSPSKLREAVAKAKHMISYADSSPEHGYSGVPKWLPSTPEHGRSNISTSSSSPDHGFSSPSKSLFSSPEHGYSNFSKSGLSVSWSDTPHKSLFGDGVMDSGGCQSLSKDCRYSSDLEELGEKVYGEAEELYPEHAEKITGMILEMGAERLSALLQDYRRLHEVMATAFEALQKPA